MSAIRDTPKQTASQFGVDAQAKAVLESKVGSITSSTENMGLDFEHQKRVEEKHDQHTQMQIATAMSASPTPGSHGSPKNQVPLATHRLLVPEAKISGSESVAVLEDWFDLITMKVNLIYPEPQMILDWAGAETSEITAQANASRMDGVLATEISSEMYVLLKCKTELTAGNHLKPISSEKGLEAWRILKKDMMGRDGPRQEEKFNAIADLPKLKPADMSRFDNLYVRWEAELKKHDAISKEYFIGKYRKRQIVYRSLPDEIQKSVDAEVAKQQLQPY